MLCVNKVLNLQMFHLGCSVKCLHILYYSNIVRHRLTRHCTRFVCLSYLSNIFVFLYLATVTARARRTFGIFCQFTGDWIAARVQLMALLDRPAVTLLAILHYAVAASPAHLQLSNSRKTVSKQPTLFKYSTIRLYL